MSDTQDQNQDHDTQDQEMTRADHVWECATGLGLIVTDEECIQAAENSKASDSIELIVAQHIISPLCDYIDSLPSCTSWSDHIKQACAVLRTKTYPECDLCEYIDGFHDTIDENGDSWVLSHQNIGYWIHNYFISCIGNTPFRSCD